MGVPVVSTANKTEPYYFLDDARQDVELAKLEGRKLTVKLAIMREIHRVRSKGSRTGSGEVARGGNMQRESYTRESLERQREEHAVELADLRIDAAWNPEMVSEGPKRTKGRPQELCGYTTTRPMGKHTQVGEANAGE